MLYDFHGKFGGRLVFWTFFSFVIFAISAIFLEDYLVTKEIIPRRVQGECYIYF